MMRLAAIAALLASLVLTTLPAFADYVGDQMDACGAPLTPESRATIIEACSKLIQMGELPAYIQGPAFIGRGNAYGFAADFPRALADFAVAIDIDPKNPAPLAARGMTLMKQKKFADASADFSQALTLDGESAIALYGRGLCAQKLGQDGAADMAKATMRDSGVAGFYATNGLVP